MAFETFIFVNVAGDHTKSAYKTMTRIEGVKEVFMVTGVYDIIVHVVARDMAHLGESILPNLRAIDGITRTMTCLVLPPPTSHL